jgi:hypothetical protein
MALTDISKHAESAELFINDLAKAFREKRWVKILSLIGVVCALLLNPFSVEHGLKLLQLRTSDWKTPSSYLYVWLIITALCFVAAFLIALLTKQKEKTDLPPPTSIIKGLLPYTNTKEDAEWFARLQRGSILQDCLRFCLGKGASFAILTGESGTGKSSFLQAGLSPNLDGQGQRAVYVKLTDNPSLDSIRQSLNGDSENSAASDPQTLLALLQQATRSDKRPTVLILDQFEQFFTQNKSKPARKSFIEQMAEWHKQNGSLPIKILISLRDDFADRMSEFQKEMDYTLTAHNKLRLEKFEPQEAAQVIGVIAREAKIEMDEDFVKELTRHELADKEEGTVSPVDIQILSWMLAGQKSSEERAFNRRAFQKLGGVEGLLERFLNRQLDARETEARRQAAVKVMLALTDQYVRAGALSLKALQEKLSGVVPADEVAEAVSWLARSEVRLVTPVQEKNVTLYELAHERIIPPLRRLAFKEITDVVRAQQTLDRRINEWIGNNRARRYLLTFKEWWLIKRNRALITLGAQKEQKEEFLSLSKGRFVALGLAFVTLLTSSFGGYAGYAWYERRPARQLYYAQKSLIERLTVNNDPNATGYAALLLPVLDSEKDQELSPKLWEQINNLAPDDQADVLSLLAMAYSKLSRTEETVNGLNKVRQAADIILQAVSDLAEPNQFRALSFLTIVYSNLSATKQEVDGLNRVLNAAENLTSADARSMLLSILVEAYGKLSVPEEAVNGLDKVKEAVKRLPPYDRVAPSRSLIESYSKLPQTQQTVNSLKEVREAIRGYENVAETHPMFLELSYGRAVSRLTKRDEAVTGLDKVKEALAEIRGTMNQIFMDEMSTLLREQDNRSTKVETLEVLDKVRQAVEQNKVDSPSRAIVLSALAIAYSKLATPDEALEFLDKIRQGVDQVYLAVYKLASSDQARVLPSLAEAYSKLSKPDEALTILAQAQQVANASSSEVKSSALIKIATVYARLYRWREALVAAQSISNDVAEIEALSGILIIGKDSKNGTKNMDALEGLFQKVESESRVPDFYRL